MLELRKTVSFSGTIRIDGENVVHLSGHASDGSFNTDKHFTKSSLYELNKETVDAEIKQFEDAVYAAAMEYQE